MTPKPKKLHIVMLIEAWFPRGNRKGGVFGGGQVHVRELRHVLQKKYNCHVELFYPAHPNIAIRLLWSFYVIVRLFRYVRLHKVDLIHSHGYNSGFPAVVIGKLFQIPTVHTVHGSSLIDQNASSPKAWLERWLLTGLKYSAQISVSSNFLKHKNVNQDITVIPNGVNIAEFNAVKVKKNDIPTIIWVGRKDKVKGIDILKKAILKVRKRIPNVKTELVTNGRLYGKSLIKAYKRSHVFVLPSYAEGQPITLLEAWAAKLPVVVTNVGENPNMVIDGINGFLVPAGNSRQLASAILKVLRAKVTNVRMGEAGYALVKQKYTWEKVAHHTYQTYLKVIASHQAQMAVVSSRQFHLRDAKMMAERENHATG